MKHTLILPLLAAALLPAAAFADATPVKLSSLDRSIFFRDGKGTRGNAGFNGGHFSDKVFDGNFSNYAYQNGQGAELVVPTTDASSGDAWYVTEIKIGHKGNTQYSLYYTTEAEPDNILYNASDPRSWTPIPGATGIANAAGIKVYPVNITATAVKYVFDTTVNWNESLGEIEVWGVDPAELGCLHANVTDWEPLPATASCTSFGIEQRQCLDCGEWFRRESSTVFPLGHDFQTVLVERGTSLAYGSGTNVCKRCGLEIAFAEPLDLVPLGGISAPGIVQFTDISVSSSGNADYGVKPDNMIDGDWRYTWDNLCRYWYAETIEGEYAQVSFSAPTDLTWIEFSVPNENHIVQFFSWDGMAETLIGECRIDKNTAADAPNFQRKTFEIRGVTVSAFRVRVIDISESSTAFVSYGKKRMTICELHPYGTVAGAGKSAAVRTRIIID